jgi:23S rRNA pseudouridine1911/1915/1917 synthase
LTSEVSLNEDEANKKAFFVEEDASGRLDVWLSKTMAGEFSRNRIKSLIEAGAVTINDLKILEPKKKIVGGQCIEITIPKPEDPEPKPENIPLDVLFEDEHIIVINKPAGLVVHPGAGNPTGTLVNALLHHCGSSLSGIGGVKRPGIVHRLDKDTSGVMIVAKHDAAHRYLSEQFADHGRTGALERSYIALIWGAPNPPKGIINTYLGRSNDRLKRAVCSPSAPGAKHALTHFKTQNSFFMADSHEAICSLVECNLETGRTHQIRVHMAHIGHPLVGDDTYGAAFRTKANKLPDTIKSDVALFSRQALHAYLLQIVHPISNEIMRFETKPPKDMATLIDRFSTLKS